MNGFDLWKLATEYSVAQAALIIAGHRPEIATRHGSSDLDNKFVNYTPAKVAICNAIRSGTLTPVQPVYTEDSFDGTRHLNIFETLVSVSELNRFLKTSGLSSDYFDRPKFEVSKSLDANSVYFSNKLDAANKAWSAVTSDPTLLVGKSPKQALRKWLTDNAVTLRLLNKDGSPNQTGIDEICKVANWKPEGGATPTHSSEEQPISQALIRLPSQLREEDAFSAYPDGEIPF